MPIRAADIVRPFIVLISCLILAAPPAAGAAEPRNDVWDFRVDLDGQPIGRHRFTVSTSGDARQVSSDASFQVRVLGFTAYRYRHEASERWRGDCLTSIAARTDDNGTPSEVRFEPRNAPAALQVVDASPDRDACLMTFAYWNPAMRLQTRLLNAQTGKVEVVQVRRFSDDQLQVRGRAVAATSWRISGVAQPIDVWYDADGRWIGLDTVVAGGRRLTYRLQ